MRKYGFLVSMLQKNERTEDYHTPPLCYFTAELRPTPSSARKKCGNARRNATEATLVIENLSEQGLITTLEGDPTKPVVQAWTAPTQWYLAAMDSPILRHKNHIPTIFDFRQKIDLFSFAHFFLAFAHDTKELFGIIPEQLQPARVSSKNSKVVGAATQTRTSGD